MEQSKMAVNKWWIFGGAVLVMLLFFWFNYAGAKADGARMEEGIRSQYNVQMANLTKYSNQVVEAAQVTGMARDDLKEVAEAAMQGRYGENGSQAMFQAIQEAYPGQVDPQLYRNIQDIIVAGRQDFHNDQKLLQDKVRVYRTALAYAWRGAWLDAAGYPRSDFDFKTYEPILNERAANAAVTHREEAIQLR